MSAYSLRHFSLINPSTHSLDMDCDIASLRLMIQLKVLYDLRNQESYPFIDFVRFLKRNLPLTDMIEFDKIVFMFIIQPFLI